jgi:glycosyltransferase involved in cell wall biosynthesis
MKILYLYSEAMGYTLATIRAIVKSGAEVHLVHDDRIKLTPYQIPSEVGVRLYPASSQSRTQLLRLASKISPDLTYVSGWANKDYLAVAEQIRSAGATVVTGLDNPWLGSLRQHAAAFACRFGYLRRYFSHVWVAGHRQYEYARRLGFSQDKIVFDLYSADLEIFHRAYADNLANKQRRYPHRFLYVGRFASAKGLDILLSAWKQIDGRRGDWELRLIGNGPLRGGFTAMPGLVVKDFLQPEELRREVAEAGCFVLPSRREPWGVVVHEFAAAGLPLILTGAVGAGDSFLLRGYNGLGCSAGDENALAQALTHISALSDASLLEMGRRSHELSFRITPDTSAANLLSLATRRSK